MRLNRVIWLSKKLPWLVTNSKYFWGVFFKDHTSYVRVFNYIFSAVVLVIWSASCKDLYACIFPWPKIALFAMILVMQASDYSSLLTLDAIGKKYFWKVKNPQNQACLTFCFSCSKIRMQVREINSLPSKPKSQQIPHTWRFFSNAIYNITPTNFFI